MKDRLLATLGICRKAGKLIWGNDAVIEAVTKGQAAMVLLAGDLSPRSVRQQEYYCDQYNIRLIHAPVTMDEIWFRLGKRTGILAVTDRGLADTIQTALARMNEEE